VMQAQKKLHMAMCMAQMNITTNMYYLIPV